MTNRRTARARKRRYKAINERLLAREFEILLCPNGHRIAMVIREIPNVAAPDDDAFMPMSGHTQGGWMYCKICRSNWLAVKHWKIQGRKSKFTTRRKHDKPNPLHTVPSNRKP